MGAAPPQGSADPVVVPARLLICLDRAWRTPAPLDAFVTSRNLWLGRSNQCAVTADLVHSTFCLPHR
jgi:hypothetical protein